jgi:DNA polymerase (family 10)
MLNQKLSKIFYEFAGYFEMEKEAFKPQAYEKAARTLEDLSKSAKDIYKESGIKGLEALPGIGKGIAEKIIEYIKTGKIKEYQKLKKKIPINIKELTGIEGIGVKTAKKLYKYLKIKSLKDLEKAAGSGKISKLPGFSVKTEKNILEAIQFVKSSAKGILLGDILNEAEKITEKFKKLKKTKKIIIAGSIRRMKETVGDVDLLMVSSDPEEAMDYLVKMPGVIKVWSKGRAKTSVRMSQGFDVDLRIVPGGSFGSALQHSTGSKEHSVALRKIALSKGLTLNEYGVFRNRKKIAGETEEQVYKALGLLPIPPEMR